MPTMTSSDCRPLTSQQFPIRVVDHWFVMLFILIFMVLQLGYSACRGTALERLVIDTATVRPSVMVINALFPDEQAHANGNQIISPYGSLSILNGCEGVESLFLLLAAMIAYRARWRRTLIGVSAGTLFIYLLNQLRIVALFYALHFRSSWFEALHGYVAPTLIIFLAAGFFLIWVGNAGRSSHAVLD